MKANLRKPKGFGALFSCLIGLPLLLVMAVLSIPWAVIAVIYLRSREKRLFRLLTTQHRILPWEKVEKDLHVGNGTLIIEQANKVGARLWWTPDDLITTGPAPALELDDLGYDYITGSSSIPFVKWCFANYLAVGGGKAFLIRPDLKFPPGPVETSFLQGLYPKLKIVQTILLSENR